MKSNHKAVYADWLSDPWDKRYVILDTNTGEILDDAQGYGYRSPQKAYAAWAYKTRDKTKDAEKLAKKLHIQKWMKEHKDFVGMLEDYAFEIAKGSGDPNDKLDAKFVGDLLKSEGLTPDFSAKDLLKFWLSWYN